MTQYPYALPPPPPRENRRGWFALFLFLGIGGLILVLLMAVMMLSLFDGGGAGVEIFGKKVAVVEMEGAIGQYWENPEEGWIDHLEDCEESAGIAAVVLSINSPGGEIAPTQKVCEAVDRVRAEGKPVIAFMNSMAASGGYYVACAADEIHAMSGTITGSIGVYIELINLTELMKKIGVQLNIIKEGEFKTAGDFSREMKPHEREMFNSVIEDFYQQFLEIVIENRTENKISLARGWNEPLPGGEVSEEMEDDVADLGGVVYPSPGWASVSSIPSVMTAGVAVSATAATGETKNLEEALSTIPIFDFGSEDDSMEETDPAEEVDPALKAFATNLTEEQIKTRIADLAEGRIYTGRQAHRVGLVDRLGTLQDAIDRAGDLSGLGEDPRVVHKKVKEDGGLFGAFKLDGGLFKGPRILYLCPYGF